MKSLSVRHLAAIALTVAILSPILASAASTPAGLQLHRVQGGRSFRPAIKPLAQRSREQVTVVVHMSADSVAVARSQAADHHITDTQREAIRQQVAGQHAAIEPELVARGARVLGHYHAALNGVKVRIERGRLAELAALPGVVDVLPVRTYHRNNAQSVPFIGAPLAWQATGFRGEGMKIAIIDTGIDYTHANFGGPGTVAAFNAAAATSTLPADPRLFGPRAPKVKGGYDLVGDAYDAGADPDTSPAALVPHPDPNPLDCDGHGSHTAGTAAGFGVSSSGATYTGPYNPGAYADPARFAIGPGVAPKADLYAVRVFGCAGTTDVVVDAIDWAVDHDMDVISMSLGADFGTAQDADALASDDAARAGVIVVASSGNSGPVPYITSDPGSSNRAISVAAIDSHAVFPGAQVTLDDGVIEAIDANGLALPPGALGVVVLKNPDGTVSLGCSESEYVDAAIRGKLVVTKRGTCARVQRAQFGAAHGAAAVAMINTSDGYPPYEGAIDGVNIPFLGVLPEDSATLAGAKNATAFLANQINNPGYRQAATFSSGGPRFGDSVLKPNIAAPGVSILSTGSGTGNQGIIESGTSMAAPHVAGVAALAAQAHPRWSEREVNAAVVETASPQALADYTPALEGAGLVQPLGATLTQAVVLGNGSDDGRSVSFGFDEFQFNFHDDRQLTVRNKGNSPVEFNVTATRAGGVPHTLNLGRTRVRVDARSDADLRVSLSVPVGTVGGTHDAFGNASFPEVAGYLTFTPTSPAMNGGVTLHVPYYLVPRARSNLSVFKAVPFNARHPNGNLVLANAFGGIAATPDFYAWGLSGPPQGVSVYDTRAVGVQSFPFGTNDRVIAFAVNTYNRFSSPERAEFDVLIDVDGDGNPDFDLQAVDLGLLTTGSFTGEFGTALFNLHTGEGFLEFDADAPTDGSTALLFVDAADLGITAAHPRFSYTFQATNIFDGTTGTLPGVASFNAFSPAISNAIAVNPLAPNTTAVVPVSVDPAELARTPPLGLMVVVEDNNSGGSQAALIYIK